jgi:cell wall-associated NlpC family hydrolase
MRRAAGLVVVACALAGATAAPARADYVDVPVATLWTSPGAPRPIDRPALADPPDLRAWGRALDTTARRGLVGRIETQALLGDRVRVLERRGRWARVVVPGQPTPRDARGYPGWVPRAQLARGRGFGGARWATVAQPTARLSGQELSYGTRLPVVGEAGRHLVLATPSGATGRVRRSAVTLSPPPATGARIVAAARRFLGVRYEWGGTSAFGFDCSGLIELVFRMHGVTIPRDADAQFAAGDPVTRTDLRRGDLVFYGVRHVHHVALYVGGGRMLEAPDSSSRVRIVALRTADYAGARRFAAAKRSVPSSIAPSRSRRTSSA